MNKHGHEKKVQPDLGPKVWFTGKSLDYLGEVKLPVSLEDWEWHESEVEGYPCCIITDKLSAEENRGRSAD